MPYTVEKEELGRILASPGFRGRKLRESLSILCEVHWSSDEGNITQYDIAERLYGGTDEEKTVAVRNLISRLRTKLNEYYANNGNGLRLTIPVGEYRVEFRAVNDSRSGSDITKPDARSVEGRRRIRDRHLAPIFLSIVVGCVIGCLLWMNITAAPSEKAAAVNLRYSGNQIIGLDGHAGEVWTRELPAHVEHVQWFDESSPANNCIVLYGGDNQKIVEPFHPPAVRILSSRGETLADIDLLQACNPFQGMYSDELFHLNKPIRGDIDRDGQPDFVVFINHLYYPAVLYVISGRSLEVEYAFANSGHFAKVVLSENPTSPDNSLAIGALAVSNRMAGQFALIYLQYHEKNRHHSPNPELPGDCSFGPYRLIDCQSFSNCDLAFNSQGHLVLNPGSTALRMNYLGVLSSDPCWEDVRQHGHAYDSRVDHQRLVKQAHDLSGEGKLVDAGALFHQALSGAEDEAVMYWVRLEAARTLAAAGDPERALEFLPGSVEKTPMPLRFHLLAGDIHTILGDRTTAVSAYEEATEQAAQQCIDSLEGLVHALVLDNAGPDDLYHYLTDHYFSEFGRSATQAWLLLPMLIRGECDARAMDILMNFNLPDLNPGVNIPYSMPYPEEAEIIHALYDLELGIEPEDFPDPDVPLTAEFEYGEVFRAKISLVEAIRLEKAQGPVVALDALRSAHQTLENLARGNARAVVWSVLAAYHYGFAALEAGEEDGIEVLRWAHARYPWGRNAERASGLIQ